MNKYDVDFYEISVRTIDVEAESEEEAKALIESGKFREDKTRFHIDRHKFEVVDINLIDDGGEDE
jgi:hypothetical protein